LNEIRVAQGHDVEEY